MAHRLNDPQQCLSFFERRVVHEVAYWGAQETVKTIVVQTLDRERENILKAIGFGLAVAAAWPATRHLIITFAPYMERRGLWDSWHSLLARAIAAAQRAGDIAGEITLTALLARLCQRQSRGADVVTYYGRVIRLARRTDNRFELARCCSNLGYYYVDGGHWWRAEVLGQHALAIFGELNSQHGQAHTHNHLGVLYIRQQRWTEAETHLQQACGLWRAMGDEYSLTAFGLLNLGMLYADQKKPHEALIWLKEAYHKAEALGDTAMVGRILQNMAVAHRQQGAFGAAKTLAHQAEQISQKYHDPLQLAFVWHNLGLIYTQERRATQAHEYIDRALVLYRQLGNDYGEKRLLEELKELQSVNIGQ